MTTADHHKRVNGERTAVESAVTDGQTVIPAVVRRELDLDDGDRLRWRRDETGVVRVEVVHQRSRTFEDFEGYDGEEAAGGQTDHDAWGVDVE